MSSTNENSAKGTTKPVKLKKPNEEKTSDTMIPESIDENKDLIVNAAVEGGGKVSVKPPISKKKIVTTN